MNIVITGSLGNISKPLTQKLLSEGHSVTVISSNPEKKNAIEKLGATAAVGKLEDQVFLTEAFANADSVYCMTPFNFNEKDQGKYFQTIFNNYVHAITQNGIKKVVFLTGWAADMTVNNLLSQFSDLSFTELRPCIFYTNLYSYIDMIKENGVIMANYGGNDRLAFVSPKDIATAAAEELTSFSEANKIRYVASEELTCHEVANILGKSIGKTNLEWITLTDEQALNGLIDFGFPNELANELVNMQAKMHSGEIYKEYLKNRPVLGETKLEDFAKEFASAYHQQ